MFKCGGLTSCSFPEVWCKKLDRFLAIAAIEDALFASRPWKKRIGDEKEAGPIQVSFSRVPILLWFNKGHQNGDLSLRGGLLSKDIPIFRNTQSKVW